MIANFYKKLPHLQTLELYSCENSSILSTLSRAAHNLESILLGDYNRTKHNFEQELHHNNHGLQKLIQSQHQLKTITINNVVTEMGSVIKLLESQSNSLE